MTFVTQVFGYFFSSAGYGKGLGMYSCNQVMDSLSKRVDCESVPGE